MSTKKYLTEIIKDVSDQLKIRRTETKQNNKHPEHWGEARGLMEPRSLSIAWATQRCLVSK